ncbi:tether containing UBX domain for GLUT4 isoform X2 [Trichosurus vulpecula]|uniref:tether containing UBX domain for GLUT4 isoform X2 n=1 Tax=Trichosurus vulpecula TaxID=9337 RepID=UPI00186B00F3|nr:tether containing UBX domain for GLUT4 isoform X2 [Trichosurus vulpecula]
MAAPGSSGGPAVSVLTPNGRRLTVKVTPSTALLQVLEDTCRRQNFNPSEYDLKFQRNVLDLSLQWRFANLPNNAKLEMVPVSRSREGPETMVRIALQLDDGTRLQDTFCSRQTLWEILVHFVQTRECVEQLCESTPVCVYMRDEITGRAALQKTTLKSLGLTGGNAIIRFSMKTCESPGTKEAMVPRIKVSGNPVSSVSVDQATSDSRLSLGSDGLSSGDLSRPDDAVTSGISQIDCLGLKRLDDEMRLSSRESVSPSFVPFSGGGQRLGGSSMPSRHLVPSSTKLPKSLSSPGGPSKPKKSKPGQEQEQEPEEPMEREAVVCHPDLEDVFQAWPAELPDEFFEITVDDVRRRLAQLKSERKRLEEAPLVTRSLREAQMKEKLERYPKIALRILFPDRYILQGFFRPNETVGDLRDFVRSHLGNPELSFYLFLAPPKTILSDDTLTLFQANLFPAALVHFGSEEPTDFYLEPQLLENTISPSSADVLVARCMSRASATPTVLPALEPELSEQEESAEVAVEPPEPVAGTAQPVRRNLGKVPKWLKLPAGKR